MHLKFVDTSLRDGVQSLWASWCRVGMIDAVASDIDRAGFLAVDVPANVVFFKKLIRDQKEDPWELASAISRGFPRTVKTSMAGPAVKPFTRTPRSLTKLFYETLTEIGALNRAQVLANTSDQLDKDFPWYIPLLRECGLEIVVALAYTISPRHTDDYYAELTERVSAHQPDAIYLKDQGGLLTPERARTLLPRIKESAGGLRVELHSHCTTGLAPAVYLEALKRGIQTLHTAIPPLANGSSQPSVFSLLRNIDALGDYATNIDEEALNLASASLYRIARQDHLPVGKPSDYDYSQYVHQIPGGVISNLEYQLRAMGLEARIQDVIEESVRVRADFGYPIMITPYSQFIMSQAALNVAAGKRYGTVVDELIYLALGKYGVDSGYTWMNPEFRETIVESARARELQNADTDVDSMSLSEIRRKLGGPDLSDRDLLLRFLMGGEEEIAEMRRAKGRPTYKSGDGSIEKILEALDSSSEIRYFNFRKGADCLMLDRDIGAA